jgi:DNA (cytosine-5)-methyltransferase 1
VDLFCGAGGLSTGLALACEDLNRDASLYAINHWDRAIETHEQNHPCATHFHSKIEERHPPNVVDEDTVDILVAGPECTHFSNARGGKPVREQQRASPWHVVDWLEKLDVATFLIENVPELESWGPVEDGQPSRNGEVFDAWITTLHALGYSVDWTTLTAADYGDPTTRERLFVIGTKGKRATFPEPTHSDDPDDDLADWRPAAEIIDWSDLGGSIWTRDLHDGRKRPLKNSTMQRVAEGIRRHCDDCLAPFADVLADVGQETVRELRKHVVPAAYAPVAAAALDRPFLVDVSVSPSIQRIQPSSMVLRQQDGAHPIEPGSRPLPTVATTGAHALATVGRSLLAPKNGRYRGLHSNPLYPPETQPLHTVTADPRATLVTPSLVKYYGTSPPQPLSEPLDTVTSQGHKFALSQPYLCPMYNGRAGQRPRTRSINRPLMTIPASKSPAGLATPFLVDYHGNSDAAAVDEPLGAVETKDRYALCIPECWPYGFDVRYRMLQPRELKQAQGFPADYAIAGNKGETKTQIGNAVPVNLAHALTRNCLRREEPSLDTFISGQQGVVTDD